MAFQYDENALLFINSSGPSVPKGRNVRTQARTQQASLLAPAKQQLVYFSELDLSAKRQSDTQSSETGRKRRKAVVHQNSQSPSKALVRQANPPETRLTVGLPAPHGAFPNGQLDPREVLTVATFHIRRIAAMTVRTHPDRLGDVLRCRQWSCVSFAFKRFGKSRCLDSALFCIAAKLNQITGGPVTPMAVLSSYSEALQELQGALQRPQEHEHLDLLTTTQLLAVYEMLDSLDNPTWTQHIAGAASLVRPPPLTYDDESIRNSLSIAQTAPMFTDALLTGNDEIFQHLSCQVFLRSVLEIGYLVPDDCRELVSCLLQLPELLEDAKVASRDILASDPETKLEILDRAHSLKSRLRTGLLESDLYSRRDHNVLESFDMLGMCLAGLVALGRLVTSLRPVEPRAHDLSEDKTEQLCQQLLQLELGAADACT